MQRRPRAFYGYYHWKVYYLTRFGSILLPEGYVSKRRIPVRDLAEHPSPGRTTEENTARTAEESRAPDDRRPAPEGLVARSGTVVAAPWSRA